LNGLRPQRLRIFREERKRGTARGISIENRVVDDSPRQVKFSGGARFWRHYREPRTHRFRKTEPEGLKRGRVEEEISGGKKRRELLSVFLETQQLDVGALLCLFLDPDALGTVAKDEQLDVGLEGDAVEHREDDVPAFFAGEAAGGDQETPFRPAAEGARAELFVAEFGSEEFLVDAERDHAHAGDAVLGELRAEPLGSDDGRVAAGEERADAGPEGGEQAVGGAVGDLHLAEALAEVGVDEVRVPDEGADAKARPWDDVRRERPEVRAVNLKHIGLRLADGARDGRYLKEQVIGRVVGDGRAPKSPDFRTSRAVDGSGRLVSRRRRLFETQVVAELAPGPGGEHQLVVPPLAQNLTLHREMAANTSPSLRVELRNVNDAHASSAAEGRRGNAAASEVQGPDTTVHPVVDTASALRSGGPRSAFWKTEAGNQQSLVTDLPPFAQLAARHGRPLKVAILSDFTRIAYANGAAFQTRFLYQELQRCGHHVTVIGPKDPESKPGDVPPGTIELPSLPVAMYPGLHVPMPMESWVFDADQFDFDIVFAQTTSLLLKFGVWLRHMKGIPVLCVNTTHLVAAYDVLLPEELSKIPLVHTAIHATLKRPYEKLYASIFNESDGLVVLSEGLRTYWRERGVTAPIHVIPRAVQPEVFDRPLGDDPFPAALGHHGDGPRYLVAGRHTREKCQDRTIRIFAKHIVPELPDATLTLLGLGPDTEYYKRIAQELGVGDKVFFPGEVPFTKMVDWYGYADVFLHTSLSETYGNVLGEALWCGTPTVGFADGMGASYQIQDGMNGLLLAPGNDRDDEAAADASFGRAAVNLYRDGGLRQRLGTAASRFARERCSPVAVQTRIANAFTSAQDHIKTSGDRAASERPRLFRWWTTARDFRPWALYNGMTALIGKVRPAHAKNEAKHPQMHTAK